MLSARVERGLLAFWLWPRERGRDDAGITDCNLAARQGEVRVSMS